MAINRRQSWGGAPQHSLADLQLKYGVDDKKQVLEKEEVSLAGEDKEVNDKWIVPEGARNGYERADVVVRYGGGAVRALWGLFACFRIARGRVHAAEDDEDDEDGKKKTKREEPLQKFRYINCPKAASATKSFRHGMAAQKYNSPDLNSARSKNFEYLSEGIMEAKRRGEQGLPRPVENEEAKRRSRGFEAVRRQYGGGSASSSAAVRIKAYSYGAGSRHEG